MAQENSIRKKRILRFVATGITACLLSSCAEQLQKLDLARAQMPASSLTDTPSFQSDKGFGSKEIQAGLWKVSFLGNQYTSFSRAIEITQVRSAQLALNKGYRYFSFKLEKKLLHCPTSFPNMQYTSAASEMMAVNGEVRGSSVAQTGMIDAKLFVAEKTPSLINDPSPESKNASYQQLLDVCAGNLNLGTEYF